MRIGIYEMIFIFVICLVLMLPVLITVAIAIRSRKKDPNLQDGLVKCYYCAEKIQPDAKVCRYCGREQPEIIDIEG